MTKKQELIEALKVLYIEIGMSESIAEQEVNDHKKCSIATLEDIIEKAQKVADCNKAEKEKAAYFATEEGAKAAAEAEARLEQLKKEVALANENVKSAVDALINEKLPMVAPYQVSHIGDRTLTLCNPTVCRRLEIEIWMESDYRYNEKDMVVSLNVASCGAVDIEKTEDAVHLYYTTLGHLFAHHSEVVEIAKFLQSKLKEKEVLYDEAKKCKQFLKNPLNSPHISKY